MKINNIFFFLLVVFIIIVSINFVVVFIKISSFDKKFTGHSLSYVNLTVNQIIAIQLLRDTINWGPGDINGTGSDRFNATLYTDGDNNGTVLRGNWSGYNVSGLVLENVGNINCSIYIQTNKDAHDFFGSGSNQYEEYKIKVSDKKNNSCFGQFVGEWIDANKSSGGTLYCEEFGYQNENDQIYIDILLTVPYDSINYGEQSDVISIMGNPS